jgi:hypothetical protein
MYSIAYTVYNYREWGVVAILTRGGAARDIWLKV